LSNDLDKGLILHSDIKIQNFERQLSNDIGLNRWIGLLSNLRNARRKLAEFEDVYNSISPDCVKKLDKLIKEIGEAVFATFSTPKRLEIDLDEITGTDELERLLIEKTMNYSEINKKFLGVSEIVSNLTETRKQLFLKIS
jgi:hypothetical protein